LYTLPPYSLCGGCSGSLPRTPPLQLGLSFLFKGDYMNFKCITETNHADQEAPHDYHLAL
jgi:hypothetical protein